MMRKMCSVLLTTDTPHHRYFAQMTDKKASWDTILIETKTTSPPFDTRHAFEDMRDEYEREVLLNKNECAFPEISDTFQYDNLNSGEAVSKLKNLSPDIIIVFGTGKISQDIIQTAKIACLNLHGGNPEQYRGLDSHLWAIYHRDFHNLVTTLHYMNSTLDDGDIIFQSQLQVTKKTKLFQLRSINTKICIELSNLAHSILAAEHILPSRKQVISGRYYSFMPTTLKDDCVKKFESYTSGL